MALEELIEQKADKYHEELTNFNDYTVENTFKAGFEASKVLEFVDWIFDKSYFKYYDQTQNCVYWMNNITTDEYKTTEELYLRFLNETK
jgi:hypothetical protein